MSNTRILYVASEINPFLEVSNVAEFVNKLPQAMQEKGMEIRILVPRFGLINERRNRLHEVVRLSGINIEIGDDEKPLIIKVASIPNAKLQVYFIDNDDYFRRKYVFHDKNEEFYADNDEREIFFCKGVLETVKRLGWAPDIVHCNDWMTGLIPLYLKTTYKNDPIFESSKSIFSVYGSKSRFDHKFEGNIIEKALHNAVDKEMLQGLSSADYDGFVKMGLNYADLVINANEDKDDDVMKVFEEISKDKTVNTIAPSHDALEDYYELYTDLIK
jgi:starch synthase